jgi:hypothetical protein
MGILEGITFTSNPCFKGCWHTKEKDGRESMGMQKGYTILTIQWNSFYGFNTAYFYISEQYEIGCSLL